MAPIEPDIDLVEKQIKDVIQSLYQVMVQVTAYDGPAPPLANGSAITLSGDTPSSITNTTTTTTTSPSTRDVLASEFIHLSRALQTVHTTATLAQQTSSPQLHPPITSTTTPPPSLPSIPLDLVEYVDNGRNPDIYTRQFIEIVRRQNQLVKGKLGAFGGFRDVLAAEMRAVMPEIGKGIEMVVGKGRDRDEEREMEEKKEVVVVKEEEEAKG